ncbi:MAG TPA: ACP phosphodiesterase [Oculatellaceae cyanobacterium]|jgi:acyl carrier protein phosphodiesterase
MNWLAHIFLSAPTIESQLGNLLGDLVKSGDLYQLDPLVRDGVNRHYAIDKFTDSHIIFKNSKRRINQEYSRFAGILIDVFYDHFLAKNWQLYSGSIFSNFVMEVYNSFQSYQGNIPEYARQIIQQMIYEDWLTSYQSFDGVENALRRIDARIKSRRGNQISLVNAVKILEQEYFNIEQDFGSFFPELQRHMQNYR